MKLLISGHSSSISKDLKKIIKKKSDIEIFSVGRNKESDYFCNFADYSSLMNFIDEVIYKQKFNYFFLNHGILLGKKALQLREKEINEYMMVNCFSMIAILEALTKYKSINIVVTSSISSKEGSYDPIYASTKAGLDSFRIRCASIFDRSVRVNFISPGVIKDASMTTRRKDKDNVKSIAYKTPSKKLTTSKEVAKLACLLLLEPGNIHCQDFAINGGISLNR